MAEYIDRMKVRIAIIDTKWICDQDEDVAYDMIDSIPAADVVEVVRCRDCRHYVDAHADGSMYCMRLIRAEDYCETGDIYPLEVPVTDHCFCSYGERRKENG